MATRLQKLDDLPARTSTMTVDLRHEAAGWRVFLDLATTDKAKRIVELDRLRKLGRERMLSGDLRWAQETYESALRLAPRDRGIRHALAVLEALSDQEAMSARRAKQARAYQQKVVVDGVTVDKNRVSGEVRNTGEHALDEVEVTVTGLDKAGVPVTEAIAYPVRVSALDGGAPLPAGHARRFRAVFEAPPAAWKGAVEVRVTGIRFHVADE